MGWWSSFRALFSADDSVLTFGVPSIDNIIATGDPTALFPYTPTWTAPVLRVDRSRAMQCGAVVRARDAICGTIGNLPLYAMDSAYIRSSRALIEQPERDVPRSVTMTRTVEDMLFTGSAWWRVVDRDYTGYPTKIRRLDPNTVTIREDGKAYVRSDGSAQGTAYEYVPDADLIRLLSPNDPLLVTASRGISTLLKLDAAAANDADNPAPRGQFTAAEGADPVSDDEVIEFLTAYRLARQRGVEAFVPSALKYEALQWSPRDRQAVEARNAAVLELARFTGLDPTDLAAATGGQSSMTYQNVQDKRRQFVDTACAPYIVAIQDRLSMGDVTPRGTYVRLDVAQYERADESTRLANYAALRSLGLIDTTELLRREELPQPTEEQPVTPQAIEAPPRLRAVSAAAGEDLTFEDDPTGVVVSFASDPVSVDVATRTIRGLAVPYGAVAVKNGRRFAFGKGTIAWDPIRMPKVLLEHNRSSAIGKVVELTETDEGLHAVLRIARGPEGDRALALAEDGVLDGLSIGVQGEFDDRGGVSHSRAAQLSEISLTPFPAFHTARVDSVAASTDDLEVTMTGTTTGSEEKPAVPVVEPQPEMFSADDWTEFQKFLAAKKDPKPEVVQASAGGYAIVTEPTVYAFDADRGFVTGGEYDFATDIRDAAQGDYAAKQRALGFMSEALEFVNTTNVAALNPSKQRQDLYVDQRQYRYPLWAAVRKESLNEITPIVLPKYNSSSGLVQAHTEGTEPAAGTFTTTSQTITPGAISGKAQLTRELFDQSGVRASNLIWQKMVQGWWEALEASVVTTLNANAAGITDITLTTAGVNKALSGEIAAAWSALQYVRGGFSFDVLAAQIDLYQALAKAVSDTGEPLFPIISPNNRNGSATSRFASMNVHGVDTFPEWALAASGTVAASSWLFDREAIWAAASTPNRLDWNFGATVQSNNLTQIAYVTIGIWGYSAVAVLDTAGVREVVYDPA